MSTTPERGSGPDCAAALARLLRVAARLFCGAGVLLIGIALMQPESPLPFAQGGTALLVCALSVAGAILLIIDLDQPFDGLIHVSDAPLRYALQQLGQ